jgi:hypothetical protein
VGHVHHLRAVARREALANDADEAMPEAATAFNRLRAAGARQQAAQRQATANETEAEKARCDERAAVLSREAAEAKAKASQAAADALKPPTTSHKKQKTAFAAGPSKEPTTFTPEATPPAFWIAWLPDRWRKHETENQNRRGVPLEPFIGPLPSGVTRGRKASSEPRAEGNEPLPDGVDTRGWRWHWRRGVFGNLRSWASGNRANIAHMLAESAALPCVALPQWRAMWRGGGRCQECTERCTERLRHLTHGSFGRSRRRTRT